MSNAVSIAIVHSGLFLCGYLFLMASVPRIGVVSICALSLHVGVSIWAILWLFFYVLGAEGGYGWGSPRNAYAVIAYACIILLLYAFIMRRLWLELPNVRFLGSKIFITCIGVATVVVYSVLGYFFPTRIWIAGDSYHFILWSVDPESLLHHGFPIVNYTLTQLATLIAPNLVLAQLFPLMAVGLAISVSLFAYQVIVRENFVSKIGFEVVFLLLTLGFFVFVGNSMFILNSAYLNHHILMAGLFLLLAQIIYSHANQKLNLGYLSSMAILGIAISVARMEGFVFLIIFLFVMLVSQRNKLAGFWVMFIAGSLVLPYLFWLREFLNEESFVNARHYVVMILAYVLMLLSMLALALVRLKIDVIIAVGWLIIALSLMLTFVLKPEHMGISMIYFVWNTLNLGSWGALVWITLFGLVVVAYARLKVGKSLLLYNHDAVLHAAAFCVGVLLLMPYFRIPLRAGETDSANRMLFHFLPLFWVVVQVELVGRMADFISNRSPEVRT